MSKKGFPDDVASVVMEHLRRSEQQEVVEKAVRRWVRSKEVRHAFHPEWPSLRKRIVLAVGVEGFSSLMESACVRKEWRREPESWKSEVDIRSILKEKEEGLFWW